MKKLVFATLLILAGCASGTSRYLGAAAEPLGGQLFLATGKNSDLVVLDGRITQSTDRVLKGLLDDPGVTLRGLMIAASQGGERPRATQLAQRIKGYGLNTALLGPCFAACVDVFLAGEIRGMAKEAVIGVPIVRGRFASLALIDVPPSSIGGTLLEDGDATYLLIGRDDAFRLGLATERFE